MAMMISVYTIFIHIDLKDNRMDKSIATYQTYKTLYYITIK